jgi:dTDP-4-amino-4,6-dideoxygalactose transaminase
MSQAESTFLPFHRASIGAEEIEAVVEVLQSGWLTSGPKVKQFETEFARFTGASCSLAVNSCTAGLHLALAACGLGEGDEVIIPTMTFAATGEVVLYFKARPVLVDCQANAFHMDPAKIEQAITNRTKAIIPVHYAGYPCEMDAIMKIARTHRLKVIEDAAHSFPASYKGRMIGTIGDITCFSFYATKTITTGEGGMITTDNSECADRMRTLSLHGISRNAWDRYSEKGTWRYDILEAGFKYNLTDLQAALGIAQLAKAEDLRSRRAAIAKRYSEGLKSLDAFTVPTIPEEADRSHAWHLYVVNVNCASLRISRDRVIEELKSRGIGSSVHFIPLHLHSLYQKSFGYYIGQFPNAERQFESAISLPIFPSMRYQDVDRVITALQDIAFAYRSNHATPQFAKSHSVA